VFGTDLTEAELRYLARTEWARTAQDVLWRRSKLGLRLSAAQAAEVEQAMRALTAAEPVDSASPHG
jgi:glycerol-3-phosphate dehydrogenase